MDGRQGIKEGNSHTDEVRVSFLIISNSLGLIIWKAAGSNEKVVEQKKIRCITGATPRGKDKSTEGDDEITDRSWENQL